MKRKAVILLGIPIGAMLLGSIAFIVYLVWQMVYWQVVIGVPLEKELGFSHGSPYIRAGTRTTEVFIFEQVEPNGIMGRAGITNGTIPISVNGKPDLSFTTFYQFLENARGNRIKIQVVDGGDGTNIEARAIHTAIIDVPRKK